MRVTGLAYRRPGTGSILPIKAHDEVIAVVATGSTIEEREETTQRLIELQPLWDQLVIGLSNAALFEASKRPIFEGEVEESAAPRGAPPAAR